VTLCGTGTRAEAAWTRWPIHISEVSGVDQTLAHGREQSEFYAADGLQVDVRLLEKEISALRCSILRDRRSTTWALRGARTHGSYIE